MPYTFCEQIGKEIKDISDEIPFDIPDSWEWCKVGNLFSNMSGLSYKKDALSIKSENMIRVLRGGNILDGKYVFKQDDVFISDEFIKKDIFLKKGFMITPSVTSIEHIGKIALIDKNYVDTVAGGFVLMLIPYFSENDFSKYLLYLFSSKYFRDICRSITNKSGQAFYNLSREKLMEIYIPIPPLAEQKRIVEKIEQLLPFIEKYEQAETQLTALNTSFPEMLKKSILQEAVQGKLVPQNPDDEPASVLLERIRAEKQELIKQGKIKKNKNESVIITRDKIPYEILNGNERCIADEIPFEIPESWCWCRLGTITTVLGGKRIPAGRKLSLEKTDHIYIRVSDMKDSGVSMDNLQYVPDDIYPSISRYIINKEDIYITVAGTIGKVGKIPPELDGANLTENADRLVFSIINQDWLIMCLQSSVVQSQIADATTKVGQPKLAIAKIQNLFIPLPPVDEQSRIVAKIEEIMPYINTITK